MKEIVALLIGLLILLAIWASKSHNGRPSKTSSGQASATPTLSDDEREVRQARRARWTKVEGLLTWLLVALFITIVVVGTFNIHN